MFIFINLGIQFSIMGKKTSPENQCKEPKSGECSNKCMAVFMTVTKDNSTFPRALVKQSLKCMLKEERVNPCGSKCGIILQKQTTESIYLSPIIHTIFHLSHPHPTSTIMCS